MGLNRRIAEDWFPYDCRIAIILDCRWLQMIVGDRTCIYCRIVDDHKQSNKVVSTFIFMIADLFAICDPAMIRDHLWSFGNQAWGSEEYVHMYVQCICRTWFLLITWDWLFESQLTLIHDQKITEVFCSLIKIVSNIKLVVKKSPLLNWGTNLIFWKIFIVE